MERVGGCLEDGGVSVCAAVWIQVLPLRLNICADVGEGGVVGAFGELAVVWRRPMCRHVPPIHVNLFFD